MKKELIVFICLFTTIVTTAQIDTTSWYPLQIGNYWEFSNSFGDLRSGSTVIGDTLMPNNKVYKIIEQVNLINPGNVSYSFVRLENNAILYSFSFGAETKEIDLTSGLMELWQWHENTYKGLTNYSIGTNDITGITSSRKLFEYFYIDSSFVPPDTSAIMDVAERFQKGIGPIIYGVPLTGAIINGERYGYITDVENSVIQINKFALSQNYPNPFNPTTKIEFQIPQSSFVNLTVYNSLGQQIATLVKSELNAGPYTANFNADNLPSGIYIYKIQADNFTASKKMILLK